LGDEMKTGNQNEYNFHYNRDERLSMPNAPKLNYGPKQSIFKRNKSLAIILIDIAIILVVFSFFKIFLELPPHVDENNGYLLSLSGFSTNEEVIVRIKIEKKDRDAATGIANITFTTGNSTLKISCDLPQGLGTVLEITDTIAVSEKSSDLTAEVHINDKISDLIVDLNDN
jgi:hypothetical protein